MKKWTYPSVAFCAPFVLYCYSLAPTFLWSDSSKLALQVFHRQLHTFSHGQHSFHTLMGILFTWLPFEFAVTQHLLSAFFGALTILLLFLLFRLLGCREGVSLLGSLIIGVSHSFWLYSVITETYTIHAFFLVLQLLLVQAYRKTSRIIFFSLIFFCMGFALYNHSAAILFVLPLTVLVFIRAPFKFPMVLTAVVAFLLGVSPIFLVPALELGVIKVFEMFFRDTGSHVVTFVAIDKIIREWWKVPLYLGYQFPSLALLAGLAGFWKLMKRDAAFHWALCSIFILNTGLALGYFLQRQFALLISSYLIFGVWIVTGLEYHVLDSFLGTNKVLKRLGLLSMLLFPLVVYHTLPELYKKSGLNLIQIRSLSHRDSISYFFTPDKRKVDGARVYAEEVFKLVEENAVIVGDFNSGMALKYYQEVEKKRQDILLALEIDRIYFSHSIPSERAKELSALLGRYGNTALYLADSYEPYYNVSHLESEFFLRKIGPIIKVEPKYQNR